MSRRGRVVLCGGILVGLSFLAVLIYGIASQATPAPPQPPELGGQPVPEHFYTISFDQQYDVFCSFDHEEATIFRNCNIAGFTGDGRTARRASGSSSFSVFSGSGSVSYTTNHFDQWLVLKLSDGRLAYIPPRSVEYIEEASPEGD